MNELIAEQRKKRPQTIALVFLCGLLAVFVVSTSFAQEPHKRHVLVLHSYHQNMNWVRNINRAIEEILRPNETGTILHIENMDTKRHYNDQYLEQYKRFLAVKYKDTQFSLIISSDNNAFDFLRFTHDTLFPGIPVVFSGVIPIGKKNH